MNFVFSFSLSELDRFFLLDHQKSFSFSHLYLIFTLVAPCLSIISHYLTLSTVIEKLKRKLKSMMKQKKCDLRNKKGEEEDEKRRNSSKSEMMKKE